MNFLAIPSWFIQIALALIYLEWLLPIRLRLLVIQRIQTPMAARPALMLATHVLRLLRLLAGKLLTGVIRATIAHRVSRVSNRSIR